MHLAAVLACLALAPAAPDRAVPAAAIASKEPAMKIHAEGAFDVKLAPLPADAGRPGSFPRLSIDKTFHGDLAGTSAGEMTATGMSPIGSGAYVAVERVQGTLAGREGTFVLLHLGTMHAGAQSLSVTVAPGSGTGGLAGLEGALTIRIEPGGKHFYAFDGTLPSP